MSATLVDGPAPQSERVLDELRTLLASRTTWRSPAIDLHAALEAHAGGGKLLRPLLLLDMHAALAPDADDALALRLAGAIELLHFAFLLHDDVIDGDLLRRGRSNLIGTLAADAGSTDGDLHWARTGGILAGDLALTAALRAVAGVDLPAAVRERLLDAFTAAIEESVAGEWTDVGLAEGRIPADLDTVLTMTTAKTAAYTFALPLQVAAILAGAEPEVEARLASAGRRLGLAFQLQDDLLSTFGDASQHGKDAYSDLREGKQTALIAWARETPAWTDIADLLGRSDAGSRLAGLLEGCGARRAAEERIAAELAAIDALAADPLVPTAAAGCLLRVRTDLAGRAS